MTGADRDLIAAYLDELRAGLRMPPEEAELILAEAEDHLRETAAAGRAVGMTGHEAQQAAISSFGPVRAVVRAHRHRGAVAGAVMAAWNLVALLAAAVGAGGLVTVGIHVLFLHPIPGARAVGLGPAGRALLYGALMAGGVILLTGYRLIRRRRRRRESTGPFAPLPPLVPTTFFLVVAVLLFALNVTGVAVRQTLSTGTSISWAGGGWTGGWLQPQSVRLFDPGTVVAACLAVAIGFGLQVALRRARTGPESGVRARPRSGSG